MLACAFSALGVTCKLPVIARHELVLDCETIKGFKFSKLDLTRKCAVEITKRLGRRIERLRVFVVLVHVLVLELVRVVCIKLQLLRPLPVFAQNILLKLGHFHFT